MATKKILTDINLKGKIDADGTVLGSNLSGTNTGDQISSDFDHDELTGFVANEHIDWTTDQGSTNIHSGNYTNTNTWRPIDDTPVNGATTESISSNWAFDNVKTAVPANAVFTDNDTTYVSSDFNHDDLTGFVAKEHLDWTANQGSNNIHSGNYTNTTYTAGNGLALSGIQFRMAGGSIGGSIDLNTYTSSGYYVQGSNAYATSGSNYPVDYAGILTVVKAEGNNTHITQTYDQYNSNAFYNRSYYNGTWSTWRNLAQDSNTTYTSSDFNHDDLTGFVAKEHLDWTADQGSNNIHANNYTDTNTFRAITSTPTDGASTTSISADWAFDNVKTAVPASALFTDTVYSHPGFNGDDISIDTGVLSGATIISDLDFNVTTNTEGHVTDANGTISTRELTLLDLGYTGATNANYITNNNELTNGAGYLTASSTQSKYLRSNAADTATGSIRFTSGLNYFGSTGSNTAEIVMNTANAGSPHISFTDNQGDMSWSVGGDDADNNFKIHGTANGILPVINNLVSPLFELTTGGVCLINGATAWTSANLTNNNQLTNGAGYVTSSGNTIIGTDSDINTSGATVVDQLNMTDGVIQSHSTRIMTLADLGYTGAANANNYVHPSYDGDDLSIDTGVMGGATVISDLNFAVTTDTQGHVSYTGGFANTRTMTLADLGYTGATNANYITNNNQLTNGAGYTTYTANQALNTSSSPTFEQLTLNGDLLVNWNSTSSTIRMGDTDNGERRIHCNSNRIGFLKSNNNWGSYCEDNGDWRTDTISYAGASMRAPIFYDSNNTTYYTNPGSVSLLYGLQVQGGDLKMYENGTYSSELRFQNNTHQMGIDYQNNETMRFITRSGVTTVPITFQMRAGTITAANFILSSDERKKTKIEDLDSKAIKANWKSFEMKDNEGEYRTGVIAQELEKDHPEFVNTDDEGYKSVKYIDLLIAKVSELEARLEKLEGNGCKKCK